MDKNRLWGRVIRRHQMVMSETVEIGEGGVEGALLELCRRFDVQRPLQLPKHEREFEKFGRTFYTPEHFVEPVSFDRLEIELIPAEDADGGKRRARTPLMDA